METLLLRIRVLESLVEKLLAENAALKGEIAVLKKNSADSSKPPSSDIVKPPKQNRKKGKRKIGAQKNHPKHNRIPFPENQIGKINKYELSACPHCSGELASTGKIIKTQQVELAAKPIFVTEHQQPEYWCRHCRSFHSSPLPKEVRKEGFFRPKMTALAGYLKGEQHISFRKMKALFKDVFGFDISAGFLAKQVRKVSVSLKAPYEHLVDLLPQQPHIHCGESGWKYKNILQWAWTFRICFI